jgi:hypothetical protein
MHSFSFFSFLKKAGKSIPFSTQFRQKPKNSKLKPKMCIRRRFVIDYEIDYLFLLIRNHIRHFYRKVIEIVFVFVKKNTRVDLKKVIVQVKN